MKLFKSIVLIVSLALLISCENKDGQLPKELTYKIKGKINFKTDKVLYLQEIVGNNIKIKDSVSLNGKDAFEFSGKLSEPNFYRVTFSDDNAYIFVLDSTATDLSIDGTKELPVFKLTGSKLNIDFRKISALQEQFQASYDSLNQAYIMAENLKDQVKLAAIDNSYKYIRAGFLSSVKQLTKSLDKSIVTVYAASFFDPKEDFSFLDSLAMSLSPLAGNSSQIKLFVDNVNKMKGLSPGGMAPAFTGNTPDGRKVNLSDYKGKVVMLDFWASWCGPCRRDNPNVVKLYNKFKDKGFAILGISLDNSSDKWKQAIADDGLVWDHVSDLKGWESEFGALYNVEEIPQTFLIDKNGKIIAHNLRGEELEKKLQEIL